jgi:hypothetical protein
MEKLAWPKVHWVDWGRTYGDYDAVWAGLSSIGKEDLIPQRPNWHARPLAWWTEVMQKLKMPGFLALSWLYQALRLHDKKTPLTKHTAPTDVLVLAAAIEDYFTRADGKPLDGTIDCYSTRPNQVKDQKVIEEDDEDVEGLVDKLFQAVMGEEPKEERDDMEIFGAEEDEVNLESNEEFDYDGSELNSRSRDETAVDEDLEMEVDE